MRKFFTAAIVAASMLFAASSAQAQVKFGLKGGLNVTNMSLNSEVFDADNQTGFFIGPTVKFTLPIVGLGIDASALYDQRDAKVKVEDDGESVESKIKNQSINIPINLRYGVGLAIFLPMPPLCIVSRRFRVNLANRWRSIASISWR